MSAFSQAVNYTGKKPKADDRPQIGSNQAYATYSPPAKQGQAQPSYGAYQQQGGFPNVPQQGQRSAPDMSVYQQQGGNQSTGFRYPPSPPPSMPTYSTPSGGRTVNGAPVAVQDPSKVQRQIDELKRRGTWDHPQNARARAELEKKLADIKRAPPGYFVAPDGSLEPNYISSFHGSPPRPQQQSQQSATPPSYLPPQPAAQQTNTPPGYYMDTSGRMQSADGFHSGSGTQQQYLPPVRQQAQPQAGRQATAPPRQPMVDVRTNVMPQQTYVAPQMPMDYNTRDALIASITNSAMQQQAAGFGTQGARPPQFNWPQLYQQAQDMVAGGWSNPLAGLFR